MFYVKFIWEGIYETEKKEIYYEKTTLHGMRIAYHCDDDRDSTGGIRQQLFRRGAYSQEIYHILI